MSKLAREIARQANALLKQGKRPASITMELGTKIDFINQLDERERLHFSMSPITGGEPDKFRGLPIHLNWQMPKGEVRVE